jgi:hypothetical protein
MRTLSETKRDWAGVFRPRRERLGCWRAVLEGRRDGARVLRDGGGAVVAARCSLLAAV